MGICYQKQDLHYLHRSITSIMSQTYLNWELLICENGSTQEAINYLTEIASKNKKIHLIDGTNAVTLAEKLNRCISCASGNWIARMDDDDWSTPDRLENQVAFLQKHPEYMAVGCWVQEIDALETHIKVLPAAPCLKDFRVALPFVHPALLFRKDALLAIGGYSQSSKQVGCDDYDLMLRFYQYGYRAANLQKVLLHYSIQNSLLKPRSYALFWNEAVTRFERFRALGLLPSWLPWVIKPLLVGLIPRSLLHKIKYKLQI